MGVEEKGKKHRARGQDRGERRSKLEAKGEIVTVVFLLLHERNYQGNMSSRTKWDRY